MKQYLVSEDELRELCGYVYQIGYDKDSRRDVVKEISDFLKSKKPVEIIAEGTIGIERDLTVQDRIWDIALVKDSRPQSLIDEMVKLKGKKGKLIFVEDKEEYVEWKGRELKINEDIMEAIDEIESKKEAKELIEKFNGYAKDGDGKGYLKSIIDYVWGGTDKGSDLRILFGIKEIK